jgi:Uma2 family endonuclease
VKEYWQIHPGRKALEIYTNSGDKFRLSQSVEETGIVRSELLEGFEAELAEIF